MPLGRPPHTRCLILVSAVFLVVAFPATAQAAAPTTQRPHIILTELAAPSGDTVAEHLAATITSSIDLTMRLAGTVTVDRADFLTPAVSFSRALEYYRQVHADGAVFGSVIPSTSGGYAIDLEVWNSAKGNEKPVVMKWLISNLLSSFDVVDVVSLRVASTVVGRTLTAGTLVVKNVTGLPNFAVYADGHLLGRNKTEFRVLTGNREITIAEPGQLGDIPVESFHVDIKDGVTTTVALSAEPKSRAPQGLAEVPPNVASAPPNEATPAPMTPHAGTTAQRSPRSRFYLGLNFGEALAVAAVGNTLSAGTAFFLPVEFDTAYLISSRFAVDGELLFRLEQDGPSFNTQEIGLAVGPTYVAKGLRGFFATAKLGFGYAFGTDYLGNSYWRVDLLMEPEIGLLVPTSQGITFAVGLGVQSLILLDEQPKRTWSWNTLGAMSHYYLPVLDASLGFEL